MFTTTNSSVDGTKQRNVMVHSVVGAFQFVVFYFHHVLYQAAMA